MTEKLTKLERAQLSTDTLKHFINGGFGTITVANTKTDEHVTLRFAEPKPKKGKERDPHCPIFVSNFFGTRGQDERLKKSYAYFGCIWRQDRKTKKAISPSFWFDFRKAKTDESEPCVRTTRWLMGIAGGNTLPSHMELWHEGLCCFCGRPLTQTESIKRGYGPKCAKDRKLDYGKTTKRKKSGRLETQEVESEVIEVKGGCDEDYAEAVRKLADQKAKLEAERAMLEEVAESITAFNVEVGDLSVEEMQKLAEQDPLVQDMRAEWEREQALLADKAEAKVEEVTFDDEAGEADLFADFKWVGKR